MMAKQEEVTQLFDVFLSHNSQDKKIAKELSLALKNRGVKVWLDEEQLLPSTPWQEAIEKIIQSTRTVAVLVGKNGFGPWEIMEMRSCIAEFVTRKMGVIPVLLSGAPELPKFLTHFVPIEMTDGVTDIVLDNIEKGIFGKPSKLLCNKIECYILLAKSDEFPARICDELCKWLTGSYIDFPDPEDELAYQRCVREFLDSPDAKWLLTIAHSNQLAYYKHEVFPRLKENPNKKIIFFESGRELIEAWIEKNPNTYTPIVVLETKHEAAAEDLLTKLNDCLPLTVQRIAVVLLIPDQYPGNLRAEVYHQQFGATLAGKSSKLLQRLHPHEIEIFKWYMEKWPEKEEEVEAYILEREASILTTLDADVAIFLCGNDKIARSVRFALDKIKSKHISHKTLKAKLIMVGFDNSPRNEQHFEKSGYTLLTADIKMQSWCMEVADLIYKGGEIPDGNLFTSTVIIKRFQ